MTDRPWVEGELDRISLAAGERDDWQVEGVVIVDGS